MTKKVLFGLFTTLFLLISCAQKEPQDPDKVMEDYQNEESLEGKTKIYEDFQDSNPDSDLLKSLTFSLTRKIQKERGLNAAIDFITGNEEYSNSAVYNSIAWSIYESGENLALGADFAETAKKICIRIYLFIVAGS